MPCRCQWNISFNPALSCAPSAFSYRLLSPAVYISFSKSPFQVFWSFCGFLVSITVVLAWHTAVFCLRRRRGYVIDAVYLAVGLVARLQKKLKVDLAEIFTEG